MNGIKSYLNFGIGPQTPLRKANNIRTTNSVALLIALWLLTLVFGTAWYFFSKSPDLIIANALSVVIFLTVPFWNRARLFRTAQVVAMVNSLVVVAFNALHVGRDSWNHLFLWRQF